MGIPIAAADSIQYILHKYGLKEAPKYQPTIIPNAGRDDLAGLFAELGFESGAEIGVERGLYSEVLCRENPQAVIHGIDPWRAYRGYREHVTQSKLDGFLTDTMRRMQKYDNYRIVRAFSMDALKLFKDEQLDFVYIDGNHTLPHVINDMIEWSKKVRIGGIVSGHDYRRSVRILTRNHVPYAVHCFVESYRLHPWFLWGKKAKIPGETRDDNRSWCWVRIR